MLLLSLDISARGGKRKQKRGGKQRISQARDSFQDHAVRVRKGCSRFRAKEDEVSLLLLAGDLILCSSHPPCPGSSITSTSSWKGTSAGKVRVLEGAQGGQHPGFCYFRDPREQQRTLKSGSRGNQSPVCCSEPVLRSRLRFHTSAQSCPLQPDPGDNVPILPLETRAGCGLELQDDAPGPREDDKGQLAGIKTKQQQIKKKHTPDQTKKTHLNHKNAVRFGSGKRNPWLWLPKSSGAALGQLCVQGGLLSSSSSAISAGLGSN